MTNVRWCLQKSFNSRQSMYSPHSSSTTSMSSMGTPKSSFMGVSAAYNNYTNSRANRFDNVDTSLVPAFEALNPFANVGHSAGGGDDKRWQPVPDLYHSKESLFFRRAVGDLLKRAHEEISPSELEVRANTPEFKVEKDDWIAHNANEKNQFALITPLKTVARIPASLIIADDSMSQAVQSTIIGGFLRKRGEKNRAFKKRYMELNGTILSYYKKKPEKNGIPLSREDKKAYERGSIDLEKVSSMGPMEHRSEKFGITLVTTARTWEISAENEVEYNRWLKELCDTVKFSAVHIAYKRMFQLQEVSAKAITDVRMVVATGDTVGEIVEHIFNCYTQALDAAPLRPYDPTQYRLKVTGYRDYMLDRFRVLNEYMHVRQCLLTKKTLRLTVVHESVIQETAMRNMNIRTDLPLSSGLNGITNQFADMWDLERGNSLQMTTLGDDWDRPSMAPSSAIGSGIVNEPFAIRIHRVLNIPRHTCSMKRSSEEAVISKVPLSSSSVVVRIELYDGGVLMDSGVIDTVDVRLKAQHNDLLYVEWDEPVWHKFNIDISHITRSMRVQLTVLGIRKVIGGSVAANLDLREEKMLVTGINAFDVDGALVQGQQYVHMYNNLHTCKQGPVPHVVLPNEPMIQVEFFRFDSPIKFDWSEFDGSASSESRNYRASVVSGGGRVTMLRKEGWLHKVGNFSSLTRWRKRWFVLDQSTCTLSYADDETSPRKLIPLRNCSVLIADTMNQKYTTAPVNKGTRKERQTWCFKVRPQSSSRDYIISAETKQEREEWMFAIHTVSRSTDLDGAFLDNNENFRESITLPPSLFGPFPDSPRVDNNADEAEGKNDIDGIDHQRRESRTSENSSYQVDAGIAELRRMILMDPLFRLSPYQKAQMWEHREDFMDMAVAMPRVLSCVHWDDGEEAEEALRLLPQWTPPDNPAAYIELLNGEFANDGVRDFAVGKLSEMADTTFSYFLPQLVQAIKFENHHVSSLALLLIDRAIKNPNQIGFDLFWSMKVESHNAQYRERYGTILNAYLDVCSSKMRAILKLQDKLFAADGMFERICQAVKAKKKEGPEEMKRVMREGLEALNEILPTSFQLPIDPRIEVGKIIVNKCRVMDSAKKPLWLVFENAEDGGNPVAIMFKAGDDVRQDCLTLQLIRLMDEMWRDEGLDLAMEPYKCVATSPMTGILEMVPNSVTTAEVHKRVGILGAFKDPSFSDWIRSNNPDPKGHRAAVNLFSRSCAGYCVATCVLGIGDRHNDNIMVHIPNPLTEYDRTLPLLTDGWVVSCRSSHLDATSTSTLATSSVTSNTGYVVNCTVCVCVCW